MSWNKPSWTAVDLNDKWHLSVIFAVDDWAFLFRIKELLDRQAKDGVDTDEFSVSVWELFERVPSSNKKFLESMKPYPTRLPSLPELLNILSEERAEAELGFLGVDVCITDHTQLQN